MRRLARTGPGGNAATVGVLVSLWLGLSGLLIVARGKPEAFLVTTFGRFSHDDAFRHLNGVTVDLWWLHSFLVVIAIAAARYRQTDVLTVLMIGPVMASAIALLTQRWSDPDWFLILGECTICWLVSTVVAALYWVLKCGKVGLTHRFRRPGPPHPESHED